MIISGNIIPSGASKRVSDWGQDDSAALDYIKNRTHYIAEYTSYSSGVIETPVAGMQLLMNLSSASSSLLNLLSYESITSDYTKATYLFSLAGKYYLSSTKSWGGLHSIINYRPARVNLMDAKNYTYTVGTTVVMYFIHDVSLLSASDKEKFATKGVYLWIKEGDAEKYRDLRLLCEKITKLEKHYLPTDAVYTSDLATVATTGDFNDLLNAPEIATDEEIIEMIAQEDMLPVVADSDGALLSDENENILLW